MIEGRGVTRRALSFPLGFTYSFLSAPVVSVWLDGAIGSLDSGRSLLRLLVNKGAVDGLPSAPLLN